MLNTSDDVAKSLLPGPEGPNRSRAKRSALAGRFGAGRGIVFDRERVAAVLARAEESGLTLSRGGRIAGRVSPELIQRAKDRTGLQSDTELLEFALANVAVEDDFAQVFGELKGSVDPELDLDF